MTKFTKVHVLIGWFLGVSNEINGWIKFSHFEINRNSGDCYKHGQLIKLEPQLMSCLELFVSHPEKIVTKAQLIEQVWQGRYVSDEAVRATIKKLRMILEDDAKSPLYIKTMPRQGYKFICPVKVNENSRNLVKVRQNHFVWLIITLSLLVMLFTAMMLLGKKQDVKAINFNVSKLTSQPGSETFADYHAASQRIVYTYRKNSDSPQQLYVKDLKHNTTSRLTWDGAHYSSAYWSQNGKEMVFKRDDHTTGSSLHVVSLSDNGEVASSIELDQSLLKERYPVGFAANEAIYFANSKVNQSRGIDKYVLSENTLTAVSVPSTEHMYDYFAKESHDGEKLLILRETSPSEYALLIMNTDNGELLAQRTLPFFASMAVWHENNDEIMLSAFSGLALSYRLTENLLREVPELPAFTNQTFAICGSNCYYMRQHNGNYFDIEEVMMPFHNDNPAKTDDMAFLFGRQFDFPLAQDLPVYDSHGAVIYFITYDAKTISLQSVGIDGDRNTHACWQNNHSISAITVSPSQTRYGAIIDNRLVVNDLSVQQEKCTLESMTKPNFQTTALEKVIQVHWQNDAQVHLTSVTSDTVTLDKMNVETQQRESKSKGVMYQTFLQGEFTGWQLQITAQFDVNLIDEKGQITKVTQLPSSEQHRWQLRNNHLYFSSRTGSRDAQMTKLSFTLDQQKTVIVSHEHAAIGLNRFKLHFDVHPNSQKLLLVESLSANSDLVKVEQY